MDSRASASTPSYEPSTAGSEDSLQLGLVQSITSPLASQPPNDPFFNPPFPNDVRLPERKGWSNLLHFINKHSDGLTSATKQYFMSHLEFGGCLADYPGLKARYEKLRSLEDVDDISGRNQLGYQQPTRRIRFVNYYTASTGRPKAPKVPPGQVMDNDGNLKPIQVEMKDLNMEVAGSHSPTPTPSISIADHEDGAITPQQFDEGPRASPAEAQMQNLGENSGVHDDVQEAEEPEMQHIDSMPIEDDDIYEASIAGDRTEELSGPKQDIEHVSSEPALPPIPPEPVEPDPIDLSLYKDKDERKIADKEYKRVTKVYQQAVKDRETAIRDRKKLVEKREKRAQQEKEKQLKAEAKQKLKLEKEEEKQRLRAQKEEEKQKATVKPEPPQERKASTATSPKDEKPKRDKKFCMLPPEYGGKRDKCWIRVYMEGVDEVGAHCGLFFPGPQYESLVGDVGERIGQWVEEDAKRGALVSSEWE